jgi:hypothetical protein
MKKIRFLIALPFALTCLTLVSFKAKGKKGTPDTWFIYQPSGNTSAFDPTAYVQYTGGGAPSNPPNFTQAIHAIHVDSEEEIYPLDYWVIEYRGKPKVDLFATQLEYDLDFAITYHIEVSNRVYLK